MKKKKLEESTSNITMTNNRNIYYYNIKKVIENNNANEETQKIIEMMAYQHKLNENNVDNNYLCIYEINYLMLIMNLKVFLFNCEKELNSKLTILKKKIKMKLVNTLII
jgi:hypothetical protein